MLGNGEYVQRFLRNNALCVRQRACLYVEGTWSLRRVIDQAAAARGSNRKAEEKSNLHLVAMHCGKNQWQSDRLGVVLTLDAPGRKGRLCVCVSVMITLQRESESRRPRPLSSYCFCKLNRPSLFIFLCKQYFFNKMQRLLSYL